MLCAVALVQEHPAVKKRCTAQVRAARGLPDDLVRISAGIEDVHDLLAGELGQTLHCW